MFNRSDRNVDYFSAIHRLLLHGLQTFFFVKEILKERARGRGKLNRLNTGLASAQHIHNILQEPDRSYDETRKKQKTEVSSSRNLIFSRVES